MHIPIDKNIMNESQMDVVISMLQISAKDLGQIALDNFCPRCFWIKRKVKVPYQMPFPGIFSSIDSYTKKTVEGYFGKHGRLPDWIGEIGVPKEIIKTRRSEFRYEHGNVILTGEPDLLFRKDDDTLAIVDYKTARYTENQDRLLPIYRVQLNGYALISQHAYGKAVTSLHLVYFEPPESDDALEIGHRNVNGDGFSMPFSSNILEIDKDTDMVVGLMEKAERILETARPPDGVPGCDDCRRLSGMLHLPGLK